jgi:hypothetical protein
MIKELISIKEYARRKGCSDMAVHKAIKADKIIAGLVVRDGRRYINPEVADVEWKTNFDPSYAPNKKLAASLGEVPVNPKPPVNPRVEAGAKRGAKEQTPVEGLPEGGPSIAKAKLKSEILKAAKLELEYKEKVGSLIEKSKVYRALYEIGQEMRAAFQALPDRVVDDMLAAPSRNHAHQVLFNAIADELEKLSSAEKRLQKVK